MSATIYDAAGRPITAELRQQLKKIAVESWITEAIQADAELGRSDANFSVPPKKQMQPYLPNFKKNGIAVYVGSGNLILVDLKPEHPAIVQRRPLAQRQIELVIEEK